MGGHDTKTYQQPDAKETEQFWTKIWQPKKHNGKAEWINDITRELEGLEEGPKAEIHIELLKKKKTLKKDIKLENARTWWNTWILVQEIHLHSRQTCSRNELMPTRCTSTWLNNQRKTTLIQKDPSKGTAPNSYRPITCLPMMRKILTAEIREGIYYSLKSRGLFPDEQKWCRKWSRGTTDLLYIDKHILNESKNRRKI